jgi:serine/threonine-protein kinase
MTGIGPYELLDRIGSGGTGAVYRARHTGRSDVVAVKEVPAAAADAAGRLRREAQVLSGLVHPHVVRVLDLVEDADRVWLVSEYVDGAALSRVLAAHGPLQPEQALLVLRGALSGLAAAHRRGVVHGDVSLDNLLLTVDGTTKLVDFGLAAPAGPSGGGGTPAFVAPEVVSGGDRTPASDVYSAAAVLWTLLAGRPPFPGADVAAVLRAHVEQPAPALEGHGPELADLLGRALDKHPARRPPDAAALLAELESAAERRHGAGWAARTSLAGVAGTATGAQVAASVGAGAAEGGPVAVVSTVLGAGGRALSRGARIGIGVGVLVVAAAAAIALVRSGDDPDPAADVPAQASAGSVDGGAGSSAAGDDTALPEGNYVADTVVTGSDRWEGVGTEASLTWNGITLECSDDRCTGTIPFDEGGGTLILEGDSLRVEGTTQGVLPCYDQDTGQLIPDSTLTAAIRFTAELTVSDSGTADRRPTFTGTMELRWSTVSTTGGCQTEPPGTSTRSITLRPA